MLETHQRSIFGLGTLGAFPSPSKYPNGYPNPIYTARAGETGSTIARDITGNANNYTKLVGENPSTKCASYGMCFNPGAKLKLPPSWVAAVTTATVVSTPSEVTPAAVQEPGHPSPAAYVADEGGESNNTTIWLIGGLFGAAVIAGIVMSRKKG